MKEYKTIECDLPIDFDKEVNKESLEGWVVDSRCVVPRPGYNNMIYAFLSREVNPEAPSIYGKDVADSHEEMLESLRS